jgi:hypothetical protein
MKIFELLKIPLIKWIGIALILYFALFSNKQNPNSLGNRLSKENVQKNLDEAREKSRFIAVNVKMAQEVAKEKETQKKIAQKMSISVNDIEKGSGEKSVACNDEIEISYSLQTKEGKEIEARRNQKLIIGSHKIRLIEQNILNMKEGGIRIINIPYGLETQDKKLDEILKFNATDLKYLVTILVIKKSSHPVTTCF